MNLELLSANLLSPPILFFAMGMVATLVRSDLKISEPIGQLFNLYLLWAIGFKGGIGLRESGMDGSSLSLIVAAVLMSVVWPIAVYPLLRWKFTRADAAATAAAYGSVSVVTFIAASNFLDLQGIAYGGHLVAALALMEFPAIVTGVMIYRLRSLRAKSAEHAGGFGALLREALLGGPVFLLIGSLIVGALVGPAGSKQLDPFLRDVFQGVLVLFLLACGMKAAVGLGELRRVGWLAMSAGVVVPIAGAAVGLGVAMLLGASVGDGFLLMILSASASYIAVPAAVGMAIPDANAGVYLPMALAVTFPFNLAIGIPLYLAGAQAVLGQ